MLDPILVGLQRIGWQLTPASRLQRLEDRVEAAGFPAGWDINRIVLLKVLSALMGAALGFLMVLVFGCSSDFC